MTDIASISDFYNEWHLEHGYKAWRPREYYADLLKYVGNPTLGRLLDIGVGSGFFLEAAAKTDLDLHGVDVSEASLLLTGRIVPKAHLRLCEMSSLPYSDDYFDYVTAFGSPEHSLNIHNTLKEIVRVAKPGARVCLMVPNKHYFLKWFGKHPSNQPAEIELSLNGWSRLFGRYFKIRRVTRDRWHWVNKIPVPLRFTYVFMFELETV